MRIENKLKLLEQESDDPDTQIACCIVNVSGDTLVKVANTLPRGIQKTTKRTTRPDKYNYIMHAEQSAIAEAAKYGIRTYGTAMYINWFPCASCAQSIIQAGIAVVVCDRERYEQRKDDPRYGFAVALEMLQEAGVTVTFHQGGQL